MASTTIVPFSTLPACATNCYHLYDANGACVPPAVATGNLEQYGECFCSNSYLTPFATGTAGVCDEACTLATQTSDLASIRNWYTSFCASVDEVAGATTTTGTSGTSTGTGTATKTSGTSKATSTSSGNNTWISTHWRWVIFIVVVVVGIVGIWVGACIWHRRYLRRKDRQYALDNMRASTGTAASGTMVFGSPSQHDVGGHSGAAPYTPDAAAQATTRGSTPGTNGTPGGGAAAYDGNAEKRRSRVLIGRRHK